MCELSSLWQAWRRTAYCLNEVKYLIYSTLLSVCSLMEFGTCFMVQDFKEMNIYGKIAIDQSFSNLIEMYDPTTGVETLGMYIIIMN